MSSNLIISNGICLNWWCKYIL